MKIINEAVSSSSKYIFPKQTNKQQYWLEREYGILVPKCVLSVLRAFRFIVNPLLKKNTTPCFKLLVSLHFLTSCYVIMGISIALTT